MIDETALQDYSDVPPLEEGAIRAIVLYSPFDPKDRTICNLEWAEDKTVAQYLDGLPDPDTWSVAIPARGIEREEWETTTLKPDDILILIRSPQKGGARTLLMIAAIVAIAYFAPPAAMVLGKAIGLGAVGISALTIGLTIAGGMLVSAMLAQNPKKDTVDQSGDNSSSPSYGLDGAKATSREEVPVPIVYGEFRTSGNRVNYYSETSADGLTQTLYAQYVVSEGPIESITDFELNDQPISNFNDVSTIVRVGVVPQDPINWFASTIVPYADGRSITTTPITYTTTEPVDRIRADLTFPNGLYEVERTTGNRKPRSVSFTALATPVGGGTAIPLTGDSWTESTLGSDGRTGSDGLGVRVTVRVKSASLAKEVNTPYAVNVKLGVEGGALLLDENRTGSTSNPYEENTDGTTYYSAGSDTLVFEAVNTSPGRHYFTVQTNVIDGIVAMEILKVEVKGGSLTFTRSERNAVRVSIDTGPLPRNNYVVSISRTTAPTTLDYAADAVVLAAINEIQSDIVSYNRTASYAIKVKLTEQFNAEPNPTAKVRGRKVWIYDANGNKTVQEWSDNPADISLDILLADEWERKVAPSRIDFPAFVRWRAFCAASGLKFNGVFDYETNTWDALTAVMRVGRASPVVAGTRWSVVMEAPATPVMMFGDQNIIKGSFRNFWTGRDGRANYIEVQYYDEDNKNRRQSVFAIDDAALARGEPIRQSTINLIGVTNATQAQKEADLQLRLNQAITQGCRFEAKYDAIGCTVGDVVYVQHSMPRWGWGDRVASVGANPNIINLTNPLDSELAAGTPLPDGDWKILVIKPATLLGSNTITAVSGSLLTIGSTPSYTTSQAKRISITGHGDFEILDRVVVGGTTIFTLDRAPGSTVLGLAADFYEIDAFYEGTIARPNAFATSVTITAWTDPTNRKPVAGDQVMIGRVGKFKKPFRITGIRHESDMVRELEAIEYDEWVYGSTGTVPAGNYSEFLGAPLHVIGLRGETDLNTRLGEATRYYAVAKWGRPLNDPRGHAGANVYISVNDSAFVFYERVADGRQESRYEGKPGDLIRFRVIAFAANDLSAPPASAPMIGVEIGTNIRKASPPSNLTATPGFKSISVTWTMPNDGSVSAVEVYQNNVSNPATRYKVAEVKGNFYVANNIPVLSTFYYWIRPVSFDGVYGDYIGPVSATVSRISTAELEDEIINTAKFAQSIAPVGLVSSVPSSRVIESGRPLDAIFNTTDSKLYRWNGTAYVSSVATNDLSGTLDVAVFPPGVRPVEVVSSLPSTGNFEGRMVFLTTNDKLYRHTGSAWISTTAAADISGQIGTTQIADSAISAIKLATNAVESANIAANAVTNDKIVDLAAAKITGTLTNAQIADLAATKITGTLTNAQIADLAAAKITGQITDAQIAAVAASKLTGTLDAARFSNSLRPVEIVSTLPGSGNFEGRIVFLTTDDKLYRYSGTAWVSSIPAADVTGQLTNAQIADLDAAKLTGNLPGAVFPSNMRPVETVATLPASGNFEGRIVYLTSDDKLYRYTGSAWISTTAAADISGTLSDAQIAAVAASKVTGQLTDAQLASVAAAKVTGQLIDSQIAAIAAAKVTGTLTNAQIADLAATKITGQLTNAQIAALDAAKLTGSLPGAVFSNGLRPIEVVSTLPSSGNFEGRMVFLTTDDKLYRHTGSAWISTTAAADIAGTLADSQIAAVAASKVTGTLSDSQIAAVAAAKVTGQITDAQIAAVAASKLTGSLDIARFPNNLRPVEVVSALPTSGNFEGRMVFLTTDDKLYRYNGTAYVSTVAAADVSGTLTNSQIADLDAAKLTGSLPGAVFPNSMRPVEVVGTLPSTGNFEGRMVYLTTDDKLYRHTGSAWVSTVPATDVTGTLTNAQIADLDAAKLTGSLPGAVFPNSMRPVEVVGALPSSGNFEGRMVYLTTDDKLYRYTGSAWVSTTAAADITGTLTNAQIADLAATKITGQLSDAQIAALAAAKVTGQLSDSQIAEVATSKLTGTIAAAQFAANLRPIEVVAALPGTGNFEGRMVFLTTDDKIYRHTGSAWVSTTAAADISGTLTNAQIADLAAAKLTGQITTTQITDNAVTTAKVNAGAVTTAKVAAGAITANEIASGAVTTAKLTAGAVTANELAANAVIAGKIQAGAIAAADISAGAILASKLAIGDTSNIYPDPDMLDASLYSGPFVLNTGNTWGASKNVLYITGTDGTVDKIVTGPSFAVEPGRSLYIAGKVGTSGGGGATGRISLAWYSDTSATTLISESVLFIGTGTGGKRTQQSGLFAAPSNAFSARLIFSRAGHPTQTANAVFNEIIVRRAAGGEMVVDGAITATKIDAGAVTTAKLAAGAVTANEIAANAITAAKLTIGSLSDNLIWNSGAEAGTDGWASVEGSGRVLTAETTDKVSGAACFAITGASSHGFGSRAVPVTPGATYAVRVWVKGSTATTNGLYIRVNYATTLPTGQVITSGSRAGFTDLAGTSAPTPAVWTLYEYNWTAPSNANFATLCIYAWTGAPAVTYFDDYEFRRVTTTTEIASGAITTAKIAAGAITANEIAAGAITTAKLAANAVTANEIAAGTITATQIATDAITSAKILAGAITTAKIAAGAVTATEIAADAITATKIEAGAITTAKIATSAVTANEIAAGAITTAKIAAGAVTANEIAAATITATQIATDAITSAKILAGAITTAKIAASAVTATEIATDAITAIKVQAGAITTAKIAASAVTANEIAADAVTAAKILAGSITTAKIAAGAVTATEIATDAVTAGKIAAGAISAGKISANAITASKLAVIDTTNLIRNPGFSFAGAASADGWSGANAVLAASDPEVPAGAPGGFVGKRLGGTSDSDLVAGDGSFFAMAPGEVFNIDFWAASSIGCPHSLSPGFRVRNTANTASLAAISAIPPNNGVWTRYTANITIPATVGGSPVVNGRFYFRINDQPTPAGGWYFTNVRVRRAANAEMIVDGAVTADKIFAGAVTTAKLAAGAVTANEIAANTITAAKIAGATITATELAAGAVTTAKLAAFAVTANEIAANTITAAKIASNTITANEIATDAITSAKILAGAVSAGKIAANAVTATEIATDAVTAVKILAGSVTTAKIAALAVTANEIATDAVTASKIFAGSVTTAKLAVGAVTANEIAANAITAGKVAAGAIVASKIAVTNTDNLVPDAMMEDSDAWTLIQVSGTNTGAWVVNASAEGGTYKSERRYEVTGTGECWLCSRQFAVTSGVSYRVKGIKGGDSTGQEMALYMRFFNADGNHLSYVSVGSTTAAGVVNLAGTVVAPSNAVKGVLMYVRRPSMTGTTIWGYPEVRQMASGELIVDGAITADKINAGSVTTAKLAALAVTANELAANAVTAAKIDAGAVTTAKLAAFAVTANEIAGNTITAAQIAGNTITANEIATDAITSAKILAGAVTAGKIAANAVTANEIEANAVTTDKILAGSVTTAKIAALAVTANEIAANAITAAKIDAGAVTTAKLAALAVTANELAANAVVAGKIQSGTITATEIAAGAITASRLAVVDTTNLIQNGGFTYDNATGTADGWTNVTAALPHTDAEVPVGAPGKFVAKKLLTTTTVNMMANSGVYAPVTPGETFFYDFWAAPGTGANQSLLFSVAYLSNSGAANVMQVTIPTTATGWNRYTGHVTVPATVAGGATILAVPNFRNPGGASPAGAWYVTNVKLRRSGNSEMIVDGAIIADKILAGAVTTAKLEANAVTAAKIAAGAVTTEKLSVGSLNVIGNSCCTLSTAGWSHDGDVGSGTKTLTAAAISESGFALGGVGSGRLVATGITGTNVRMFAVWDQKLQVTAGKKITAAALLIARGGGAARVTVVFRNAAGSYLSETSGNDIAASSPANGSNLASYGRSVLIATVPATAVTATFCVTQTVSSGQSPVLIFTQTMIGIAPDNATEVGDWSPGGVTQIHGGQIVANSITVDQIGSNAVTADKIQGGAVTAGKIDANAVTANEIAANAIVGAKIAANTITAEKLVMGDFTNRVENPNFAAGDVGWTKGTGVTIQTADAPNAYVGTSYLKLASGATGDAAVNVNVFPVTPGEVYFTRAAAKAVSTPSAALNLRVRFLGADKTTLVSAVTAAGFVVATDTAYTMRSGSVTVPAGAVFAVVDFSPAATLSGSGYWAVGDVFCHRKSGADLIVDGAITAEKLSVGFGNNVIWNSCCQIEATGWRDMGPATVSSLTNASAVGSAWNLAGFGTGVAQRASFGDNGFTDIMWAPGDTPIPCTPGEVMEFQARVIVERSQVTPQLFYFDENGRALPPMPNVPGWPSIFTASTRMITPTGPAGIASPDGTDNAYALIPSSTSGSHVVDRVASGFTLTSPVFVEGYFRRNGSFMGRAELQTWGSSSGSSGVVAYTFATDTLTLTPSGSGVVHGGGRRLLPNGWVHLWMLATVPGTTARTIRVVVRNSSGTTGSYAGDDVTAHGYCYGVRAVEGIMGAPIGATVGSTAVVNAGAGTNGTTLSKYDLVSVRGVVPAGAAYVSGGFRWEGPGAAASTTPNLFFTRAMLGAANPNQTVAAPWVPGGVTQIDGGIIKTDAIAARHLTANSVTTAKLDALAVTADKIAANAITADKILAGAVTAGKIQALSITSAELATDSVTAGKILAGSVNADKLAVNAVTADKILSGSVTADKLAVNSVVAGKIQAGAVGATEIAANAITAAQLATSTLITLSSQMGASVIGTAQIQDAAISAAKIGDAQITTAKIGDLQVGTVKVIDGSISTTVAGNYSSSGTQPTTWTTLCSVTAGDATFASRISIQAMVRAEGIPPYDAPVVFYRIRRSDGAILQSAFKTGTGLIDYGILLAIDTIGGTPTYEIQAYVDGDVEITEAIIIATTLKR